MCIPRLMFRSFWFYVLLTPIIVSTITLKTMFVHKSPSTPIFKDALIYCLYQDNNIVYSDKGTAQDICIDEYMNAPWAIELILQIFLLFGFIFFIPFFFYLRSAKNK